MERYRHEFNRAETLTEALPHAAELVRIYRRQNNTSAWGELLKTGCARFGPSRFLDPRLNRPRRHTRTDHPEQEIHRFLYSLISPAYFAPRGFPDLAIAFEWTSDKRFSLYRMLESFSKSHSGEHSPPPADAHYNIAGYARNLPYLITDSPTLESVWREMNLLALNILLTPERIPHELQDQHARSTPDDNSTDP